MYELRRYIAPNGQDAFGEWLKRLRDKQGRARIETRLTRLALGQFGDCKPLRGGVWELRVDVGPGYYAMETKAIILLLRGGDKRAQMRDIDRAVECWQAHQRRKRP